MTSKDIEEAAILALKNYIQGSDVISQHISDNDKEPFWDGHLYLYAKDDKAKNSFIGRVPVQLKGKEMQTFKRTKFKYNISINDLKAYLHEPTVYIVCQEKNKGKDTLLFFRCLLPETVKKILRGKGKQDTVSVAMKSFPKTLADFENILKVFCGDAKKQISYANKMPFTFEDMKKRKIKNFSFIAPSRKMSPVEVMGYLSSHGSFLYAQIDKEFNIEVPISNEIESISFHNVVKKNVAVGGKVFFTEYKNDVKDGRLIISIGDVLTFSFLLNSDNPDCKATFRSISKTLDDSIKDAEFILALDKEECLSLGDYPLHLKVNEQDLVKDLTERIEGWKKLKSVLAMLHVNRPLDLSTIKEEQERMIDVILHVFCTGEAVSIGHKENNLVLVEIGDLKILLWEAVDEKGNSRFGDFFDGQVLVDNEFQDGKKYPISPFSCLQNDDLWSRCDNIPFDQQIESYEKLIDENPHIYEMANFDLLYMLESYDKLDENDALRKSELLKYAKKLSVWLLEKEETEPLGTMHFLNYCQVLKRADQMKEKEITILNSVLLDDKIQPIIKVGIALVIGNKTEFDKWCSLCKKEELDNIKQFPIWHFYRDLA